MRTILRRMFNRYQINRVYSIDYTYFKVIWFYLLKQWLSISFTIITQMIMTHNSTYFTLLQNFNVIEQYLGVAKIDHF